MSKFSYCLSSVHDVGFLSENNPMSYERAKITDEIVKKMNLQNIEFYECEKATMNDLMNFHNRCFLNDLQISSNSTKISPKIVESFGTDNPVQVNLFEACSHIAGNSICAARIVANGISKIAINWSGGLHHAYCNTCSGFCFVNDCNLCILELLKFKKKVFYADLDLHYGDGVADAFIDNERVFCMSSHFYNGSFFPSFGNIELVGVGKGKFTNLCLPLKSGASDDTLVLIIKENVKKIFNNFKPDAIVLQLGLDGLNEDPLGYLNYSTNGIMECLNFFVALDIPMVVLGGGGYNIPNVCKSWALLTSAIDKTEAKYEEIPINKFSCLFEDNKFEVKSNSKTKDLNSDQDIIKLVRHIDKFKFE